MPKLNNVEPPKDERLLGESTFNYTSYDGRFVIGVKPWSFETRWSAAGKGSAHLLNDPLGIEGIAIAEGVSRISELTLDVIAAADFTSRNRTVKVGQIALLRNTAGFYAAVEPLEVGYSSVPSSNVMRLRFAIQTNHSADFSPFASTFDDQQALVDQLLAVATAAEHSLQAVSTGENSEESIDIGIGHNQPPAECAITEDDRAEVLGAIAAVRQEAISVAPSTNKLRAAGEVIARVASKVSVWIFNKIDAAANEFAKTVGKIAASAIPITWLALQNHLTMLIEALSKYLAP